MLKLLKENLLFLVGLVVIKFKQQVVAKWNRTSSVHQTRSFKYKLYETTRWKSGRFGNM